MNPPIKAQFPYGFPMVFLCMPASSDSDARIGCTNRPINGAPATWHAALRGTSELGDPGTGASVHGREQAI